MPEGEGCRGKPSCAPAPPDPVAAPPPLRSAPECARRPPRRPYIGARARGGAGHLNERPIEGRGRLRPLAQGRCRRPVPPAAGQVGSEGARREAGSWASWAVGRAARGQGREQAFPPLSAHLSAPGPALAVPPELFQGSHARTHHMQVVSYAPENVVIEAAGPLVRICTPSGLETARGPTLCPRACSSPPGGLTTCGIVLVRPVRPRSSSLLSVLGGQPC